MIPFSVKSKFVIVLVFLLGLGTQRATLLQGEELSCDKLPTLFLGITVEDNDETIPFFFRSIEKLDYEKGKIDLQINMCNRSKECQLIVIDWIAKNKKYYRNINYIDNSYLFKNKQNHIEKNEILAWIKDTYLSTCVSLNCEYCCIAYSGAFMAPHTLQYLIKKNRPIIAPLLRPIPEPHDPYRNFFADVNPWGYYKEHEDYFPIANRMKKGTFRVPCVHGVYLMPVASVDSLSFTENFSDYEFISFAMNARSNNIHQYICNEKEFGFQLNIRNGEQKTFTLPGSELEVDASLLESLFSSRYEGDVYLKKYIENFCFTDYLIYRVENRDLYYVDEVCDYIKSLFIKQGGSWEDHIQEQLKKYVRPGSIAIDVGAHIGTHTLQLSRLVGDKGKVYAFEPQVKLFCELGINMYLNRCQNVEIYHQALGSKEQWIKMHIPEEWWLKNFSPDCINEGHGMALLEGVGDTGDLAKMVRLDDFDLEDVSCIKIDVEGFEMNVIEGALNTIQRNLPIMIIEIFEGNDRAKKIEQIENLGYISSHLSGADYLFIPLDSLGLD